MTRPSVRHSPLPCWAAGVLLLAVLAAAPLSAQLSSAQASRIDSIFAPHDRTDRPGCALGVYRDGQVIYARGYGMADLNHRLAISPRTVFYIASTSKQFAAASLQLLAVEGKVSLDDPVRKYVPELPAYADRITLRHLLHHQSGIRDYLGLWASSGRSIADHIPEEQALELIARQKAVDFEPGSRFAYSNSGYFLISVVVHRASGLTLREYAAQKIFQPLGMRETHFHDDNTMIVPNRAEGYAPDGKGGYRIVKTSFALVGDGGLHTTVEDLVKWDENFFANRLAGGGPAFIERLYTRGRLAKGDSTDYASGLSHTTHRGLPVIDHGGSFIGFRAQLMRFPSVHTSLAILCNDGTARPENMARRVADVVLEGRFVEPPSASVATPIAVSPAVLDRYVGRYELAPGTVASVERAGDGLQLKLPGMVVPLVASSDSTFGTPQLPWTIVFRPRADGRAELFAAGAGMDAAAAPLPPVPSLSSADRQALAGRYLSDELQATFTVKVEGDKLLMRGGYGAWQPLEPSAPGEFMLPGTKVTVQRDRAGRVTGMSLSAGRMRNVGLVRVR